LFETIEIIAVIIFIVSVIKIYSVAVTNNVLNDSTV